MEILITGILLALASIILAYVAIKGKELETKIESRFNIEIPDNLLKNAILYAEEYAAKKAKELGNKTGSKIDSKIKSNEKLDNAITFVKDFIPENVKNNYTDEKIAKLIESKIASMKDLGATGKSIGE